MTDKLLSVKEVAEMIGVHITTIQRWIKDGHFPNPVYIGARTKRWMHCDIEEFIRRRKQCAPNTNE